VLLNKEADRTLSPSNPFDIYPQTKQAWHFTGPLDQIQQTVFKHYKVMKHSTRQNIFQYKPPQLSHLTSQCNL